MKRIISLFIYLLFYSRHGSVIGNKNEKPNIIIIMADDMGYNDVGFHGSNEIPTPNIDALAYNGIVLDKFYTQHICTPSRSALLTGNYPIHLGFQGNPLLAGENVSLPFDKPTIAERMKELGYRNHLVGKWHVGAPFRNSTPIERGFDSHFGYWNGFVGYFNYMLTQEMPDNKDMRGLDLHEDLLPSYDYDGHYATELFTRKAVEVIDNHDKSNPLFLLVSHLAPHVGDNGTELGVPDINRTNRLYGYIKDEQRRRYADIVNLLDKSLGEIVMKLSERDMLNNSVIMFLSDNGAPTVDFYNNTGSNWPLRGIKFSLFEGGVKGTAAIFSPLFQMQGYVSKELMHITDILPTMYQAAGGNAENLKDLDGVSQWQTLSESLRSARKDILLNIDEKIGYSAFIGKGGQYKLVNGSYSELSNKYYGSTGRSKNIPAYNINQIINSNVNKAIVRLQRFPKLTSSKILKLRRQLDISWARKENQTTYLDCKDLCLFDLTDDPCETTNILNKYPTIVESLKRNLKSYYKKLVPQKNKMIDRAANPVHYNGTWCTWLDDELCPKTLKI